MQRLSLRERKKIKTRETLIAEANRLFLEKGFEATTVEEIADAADVSPSTFFRYFTTKEAVVFPRHEEQLARFETLLKRYEDPRKPFETIRNSSTTFAQDYIRWGEEALKDWRIVVTSPTLIAHDAELDREYKAALADVLLHARPAYNQLESKVIAGAIFGALTSAMHVWYEGKCKEDLLELGAMAFELIDTLSKAFGKSE